jgi:hypothetical protein
MRARTSSFFMDPTSPNRHSQECKIRLSLQEGIFY